MIIVGDGDGLDLNYNITSFKGLPRWMVQMESLPKKKPWTMYVSKLWYQCFPFAYSSSVKLCGLWMCRAQAISPNLITKHM
jgi:hypothetical protein